MPVFVYLTIAEPSSRRPVTTFPILDRSSRHRLKMLHVAFSHSARWHPRTNLSLPLLTSPQFRSWAPTIASISVMSQGLVTVLLSTPPWYVPRLSSRQSLTPDRSLGLRIGKWPNPTGALRFELSFRSSFFRHGPSSCPTTQRIFRGLHSIPPSIHLPSCASLMVPFLPFGSTNG